MAQVLHSRLKIVLDHNSSARWSAFQIRKIAKVLNWQAGRTKYDRIKQLTTGRADCEAFLFYLRDDPGQWQPSSSFSVSVDQFTGNKKPLIEALPVSNSCPKCLVEWLPVCDIKVAHNGGTLCAQPATLFLLFRCDNISSTESVPQTFVSLLFRFPLNLARRLKSWSRKSMKIWSGSQCYSRTHGFTRYYTIQMN